jgi:hypothetical protein
MSHTMDARLLACACLFSLAAGCGANERSNNQAPGSAGSGPLYVVSTNVFSPDGITGYVALVPSLEASVTMNLDNAIEGRCSSHRSAE